MDLKSFSAAVVSATVLTGSLAAAQPPASHTQKPACDRACLGGYLDRYMSAVFKHDPKEAPLAANYRATLDGADLPTGKGVWLTARKYGNVQRRFFDPITGNAAYFGDMIVNGEDSIASVRIKVDHGRITEAEWTLGTKENSHFFDAEGLAHNPPPLTIPLDAKDRVPREQMVATANSYFQAINDHDGSKVPHIVGCDRIENGAKVTHRDRTELLGVAAQVAGQAAGPGSAISESAGCTDGLQGFIHSIANVNPRRFPLVDEEAGVVMGTTILHRPPESSEKRNLLTEYLFLRGGRIADIYAAMWYLDPSAPDKSGW